MVLAHAGSCVTEVEVRMRVNGIKGEQEGCKKTYIELGQEAWAESKGTRGA